MSNGNNADVVSLIPACTPHPSFSPEGVFHPMTLLEGYKPGKTIEERVAYSGYSSIYFGSLASNTVAITVPQADSAWKKNLVQLASQFVDPANILAEVEILEAASDVDQWNTIAAQLGATFSFYKGANRVWLIWPYQTLDVKQPMLGSKKSDVHFTYTHQNLIVQRKYVPECISLMPEDKDSENEMVCKSVSAYADVDDILKGAFTRCLSAVEVRRDEYDRWRKDSPTSYDIQELMKIVLVGKKGVLMNYKNYSLL